MLDCPPTNGMRRQAPPQDPNYVHPGIRIAQSAQTGRLHHDEDWKNIGCGRECVHRWCCMVWFHVLKAVNSSQRVCVCVPAVRLCTEVLFGHSRNPRKLTCAKT